MSTFLFTITEKIRYVRIIVLSKLILLFSSSLFAQSADSVVYIKSPDNSNLMKLESNGGLLVRGTYDGGILSGEPPTSGPGTRLMWFPNRAAFRVGYVDGTYWDNANIGYFSVAIGENTRASGDNGVAFGKNCVAAQVSSFAVGENNTASGAASVALGYHSHTNARQGSFVFADRSSVDTLRAGVNHSANWRVSGGFRIFTSSNLSTGISVQSGASVSNWGQSNAVISTSTGALLSTGGVWTNASDVNKKHLFEDVSGEYLLGKLRNIPISEWSYKKENAAIRHIGPTAQDFRQAFGLGVDELSIGTVDADGVSLACIQALESRTRSQATELEKLKTQNEQLLNRLVVLEDSKKIKLQHAAIPIGIVLAGLGVLGSFYRNRKKK